MVLQVDSVVKLSKILLTFDGEEEITTALNLIVNGTVCCVGFHPHNMTPKAAIYDGAIMQALRLLTNTVKVQQNAKKSITTLACALWLLRAIWNCMHYQMKLML